MAPVDLVNAGLPQTIDLLKKKKKKLLLVKGNKEKYDKKSCACLQRAGKGSFIQTELN